eukprot:TRINITY_DN101185_c0_g1_i1.p1 TRINITY_DN101185_c0_g1~~TRINITY_DN101185_c0_g1_i1.p1  ORF type:complete len:335 (-),score=26.97 TRINITY_DN101185_c0_g1_i1:130-1134(-)
MYILGICRRRSSSNGSATPGCTRDGTEASWSLPRSPSALHKAWAQDRKMESSIGDMSGMSSEDLVDFSEQETLTVVLADGSPLALPVPLDLRTERGYIAFDLASLASTYLELEHTAFVQLVLDGDLVNPLERLHSVNGLEFTAVIQTGSEIEAIVERACGEQQRFDVVDLDSFADTMSALRTRTAGLRVKCASQPREVIERGPSTTTLMIALRHEFDSAMRAQASKVKLLNCTAFIGSLFLRRLVQVRVLDAVLRELFGIDVVGRTRPWAEHCVHCACQLLRRTADVLQSQNPAIMHRLEGEMRLASTHASDKSRAEIASFLELRAHDWNQALP